MKCSYCNGKGETKTDKETYKCVICNGTGKVPFFKTLKEKFNEWKTKNQLGNFSNWDDK